MQRDIFGPREVALQDYKRDEQEHFAGLDICKLTIMNSNVDNGLIMLLT